MIVLFVVVSSTVACAPTSSGGACLCPAVGLDIVLDFLILSAENELRSKESKTT